MTKITSPATPVTHDVSISSDHDEYDFSDDCSTSAPQSKKFPAAAHVAFKFSVIELENAHLFDSVYRLPIPMPYLRKSRTTGPFKHKFGDSLEIVPQAALNLRAWIKTTFTRITKRERLFVTAIADVVLRHRLHEYGVRTKEGKLATMQHIGFVRKRQSSDPLGHGNGSALELSDSTTKAAKDFILATKAHWYRSGFHIGASGCPKYVLKSLQLAGLDAPKNGYADPFRSALIVASHWASTTGFIINVLEVPGGDLTTGIPKPKNGWPTLPSSVVDRIKVNPAGSKAVSVATAVYQDWNATSMTTEMPSHVRVACMRLEKQKLTLSRSPWVFHIYGELFLAPGKQVSGAVDIAVLSALKTYIPYMKNRDVLKMWSRWSKIDENAILAEVLKATAENQ